MKSLVFILFFFLLVSCNNKTKNQIEYGSNLSVGKYIDINDITIYYEIYGEGEPLLLMHGGGGSIQDFVFQIPELSKHFKIIAVDSRAHGRTTDSDKEITYTQMASDMADLIDKLNLGSVNVLGWSDGGNNGLELAYAYPGKVRKLITCGADYTHVNWIAKDDSIVMDPNDPIILKTKPFLEKYFNDPEKLSPDPEKIPGIKKKLADLWDNYPNFTTEQLKKIITPTLIIAGDHDIVNIEQTIVLFNSLSNSQLCIIPGASHLVLIEQSELINSIILNFLQTPFRKINNYYFFKESTK
jgi:pimeloyl-ACP methyl ester carboxylesterase